MPENRISNGNQDGKMNIWNGYAALQMHRAAESILAVMIMEISGVWITRINC